MTLAGALTYTASFLTPVAHAQSQAESNATISLESQLEQLIKKRDSIENEIANIKNKLEANRQDEIVDFSQSGNPVYTKIGNGELRIKPLQNSVYILKNAPPFLYGEGLAGFLSLEFKTSEFIQIIDLLDFLETEQERAATAGYFEINGKPEKVLVESASPEIATVSRRDNGVYAYRFFKSGIAEFVVTVAGVQTSLKIPVIEIQVSAGMSTDQIIETLGFPTEKETHYISWPKSKWIDSIHYTPIAGRSTIAVDHWLFDRYPRSIVAIQDGKVVGVGYKDKYKKIVWDSSVKDPEREEYKHWKNSPLDN